MDPQEVRTPEYEFNDAWEYARMKGEAPLSWEGYWQKDQYISIGKTTREVEAEGMGGDFMPLIGKDADRLSPARRDHVQVPWFQCITHACRYHFQLKFDFDHWPVRRMDRQGRPMALLWTQWLREYQALDASGTESEGDASSTLRMELGNGSGPFVGPVDA
ncbi:hypothetical protein N658DRAFT_502182 [Parathielavia hyrcaniae]|uniref:Uncharacterized protein n=1 Tax=Parathielavia hyrcaniae TaxID=113614 RepID=A0AAN6PQ49_9PEZI|nr:hypothetical protein N658DRAFT_502182 [Parathielavia hyrcaniae]